MPPSTAAFTGTVESFEAFDAGWLVGFDDGEGCFHAGLHRNSSRGARIDRTLVCTFIISVRADDLPALVRARSVLGDVGRIGHRTPTWTHSKPIVRWEVSDLPGLAAVVAFFDRWPLQSKKARDFTVWRQLALLKQEHPPGCGVSVLRAHPERVEALVDELRAGRTYAD